MRVRHFIMAALMLVTMPGAGGIARAQVCDSALALRVNDKGMTFIADQVRPLIPSRIEIPAVSQVVVNWPLTDQDAEVRTQPMTASIELLDLELKLVNGELRVSGRANITTGGSVEVLNPYVGLGSANCVADVQVLNLALDVRLAVNTHAGMIKVAVHKALVSLDNDNSVIALKACALGKALSAVVGFLTKHFMGTIQSQVEKIAKEKIPALVASKLGDSLQISKEIKGFNFTGRLDHLETDDHGLEVKLGVGVGLKQPSAPACLAGLNLTPPATCSGVQAALKPQADAMFGAGLSQAVLNQAMHTVWRSGMLCINSSSLKQPTIKAGMDKLAVTLGQPKDTKLSFALRLMAPPRLLLTGSRGVELLLHKVLLQLAMVPPGGPHNVVVVSADLAVGVKPWIDPSTNTIALDITRVSFERLELPTHDGSADITLDPARLERFIQDVALPVLRERLSSTVISPSVLDVASMQVAMKQFNVNDGHLALYVDAHRLNLTGDKTPPNTIIVTRPGLVVGPQVQSFVVKGSDNKTPAALLKFRARVDNGAWTEPSYGGRIAITTHRGVHRIQVAAVDHDGNADPSPSTIIVTVDDVMPTLQITAQPEYMVYEDQVQVAFVGSDDQTSAQELVYTAQLFRVPDNGGAPRLLATRSLPPGASTVEFSDLQDGVYNIRVKVQDRANNVTSQNIGFVVEQSGGCNLSASSPELGSLLLYILLAFALCRRLRTLI